MRAVLPRRPRLIRRLLASTIAVLAILTVTNAAGARQQHAGAITPADIEAGSRLYAAQCAACHGPDGNLVPGIDLRQGRFRRGSSDEDLTRTITQGIPGTAMTAQKLTAAEVSVLLAYLRSMNEALTVPANAVTAGDIDAGRRLVESRDCLTCHRIGMRGARQAADLSDIGAIRTAAALEASVADPGATVAAQRRYIRAVTASGRVVKGRRLNEDTFTVQLIDDRDRLVSLVKSELRTYEVSRASPSPVHTTRFDPVQRTNVVAYLSSLKGIDPGPQRGTVPR
jgi:putative heme-binding domain-containing protein